MPWWARWLGDQSQLSERQQQRLDSWKVKQAAALDTPVQAARCVVIDVETSGLNMLDDRLISIGAVAVVNGQIALGDSFSVVLQQATASNKDNILLHGIGGSAQTEGVPAADALLDFVDYLGKDLLVAFHVTFDRTMIQRAMRQYLGMTFKHPWVDLAYVAPALNPGLASRHRSLDDWTGHFSICNDARHNALADAFVTAQLFQILLGQARSRGISRLDGLLDLEKAQRWVDGVS